MLTGFVQRSGDQLVLAGEPYRITGGNLYYLAYAPDSVLQKGLDLAQSFGMSSLRIWAFLDALKPPAPGDRSFQYWDPVAQAPALNDGPNGLERLDHAIAQAGQRDIRLILTLTNNWTDFGGMPRYVEWFGMDPGKDKNRFYTDARCKQAYRHYVEQIVTRRNTVTGRLYRDEPAILAWELANEPRCENNGGVETLFKWVEEMSGLVRSLDANHLVAAGDEGIPELLGIDGIDFGTTHLYPQILAKDQDPGQFGLRWIRNHLDAGRKAGKPVLLEEYGVVADKAQRDAIFDGWLTSVEDQGGAGHMLWMIGLPKSDDQWYAPDEYVVGDPADAPSIRAHCLRK